MKFLVTPLNQFTYILKSVPSLITFLKNNQIMLSNPIIVTLEKENVSLTIYHELLMTPTKPLIKLVKDMIERRQSDG